MPRTDLGLTDPDPRHLVFGIVIVTHNHRLDIPTCLSALQKAGAAEHAVVIVRDCGSMDGSADAAAEHAFACTVLRGENVGFGQACNEAVTHLPDRVTHLLLLNPDTEIHFSLRALEAELQTNPLLQELGCAGLRQIDRRGNVVWSWDRFPTVGLEWKKALGRPLVQRSPDGYIRDREVDWVMGALLVVPRQAFEEVGGFDDRYFLFYEEIDLCQRLKQRGRGVVYLNGLDYSHKQDDKANVWREVLRLNSRRIYDRRWLSPSQTLGCQLAQTVRWLRTLVLPSLRSERRYATVRLLATWGLLEARTDAPGRLRLRLGPARHAQSTARRC